MVSITTYFGIADDVPFFDAHVDNDNRMFLDPHAIRCSSGPESFRHEALQSIDTFAETLTGCVSDARAGNARGRKLLTQFPEPWETRLGMSARGYRGKGGAEGIGSCVWDVMTTDLKALVAIGRLARLEELPMFVAGVDRDITSDITTRIIFDCLVAYTQAMVDRFPEFVAKAPLRSCEAQVWDADSCEWVVRRVSLPVVDDEPLLLVPVAWVRSTLLMSAERYYGTTVLGYVQAERTELLRSGDVHKPTKQQLRQLPELRGNRITNLTVTTRAADNDHDLVADFTAYVARKLDSRQLAAVS